MTKQEQIDQDLVEAIKTKDQLRSDTLRYLKSKLQNKAIELKKDTLSDSEVNEVIGSEIKKRKESIAEFKKGKRTDLASAEEKELSIIEKYAPAKLSEKKLKEIIQKAIAETGANNPSQMGQVMGKVMPQVKGQADGQEVTKIVQNLLKS